MRRIRIKDPRDEYPDLGTIDSIDGGLVFLTLGTERRELTLDQVIQFAENLLSSVRDLANK